MVATQWAPLPGGSSEAAGASEVLLGQVRQRAEWSKDERVGFAKENCRRSGNNGRSQQWGVTIIDESAQLYCALSTGKAEHLISTGH